MSKRYEIIWHTNSETYMRCFSVSEEDYMNQLLRDLQERLNVTYIEKVTRETIS